MSRLSLPTVKHELFLGRTGFIGLRCDCGFVATGRSALAVDTNMTDHARAVHLGEHLPVDDDEDTLET